MSLQQLPETIWNYEITSLLTFKDSISLRKTNRAFNSTYAFKHDPRTDNQFAAFKAASVGNLAALSCILNVPYVDSEIAMIRAATVYDWEAVNTLFNVDETMDPSAHENFLMKQACNVGNMDIVQLLLNRNLLPTGLDISLMIAVEQNEVEIVEILLADDRFTLSGSQLSVCVDTAIERAFGGDNEMFLILVPLAGAMNEEDEIAFLLA
jgi:hypothetical protein